MSPAEVARRLADLDGRLKWLEALMGADEKRSLLAILNDLDATDKTLIAAVDGLLDRVGVIEAERPVLTR